VYSLKNSERERERERESERETEGGGGGEGRSIKRELKDLLVVCYSPVVSVQKKRSHDIHSTRRVSFIWIWNIRFVVY